MRLVLKDTMVRSTIYKSSDRGYELKMKFDKFELFIVKKLSKKEKLINRITSYAGVAILLFFGIVLLSLTIIRYSDETLLMGIIFLDTAFMGFLIKKYQVVIRKLLDEINKTDDHLR